MADVFHAAAYLTERLGNTTTWQLQKLLYYSQGCHLSLHGTPLFDDPIEAWTNGPVVRNVWDKHRTRMYINTPWPDRDTLNEASAGLSGEAIGVLNEVAASLGNWNADALVDSTHDEKPWRNARGDMPSEAYSRELIDHEVMRDYFDSVCLASRRELTRDELSPAAFEVYLHFAHLRAFTVPPVEGEAAAAWLDSLDAPPQDLPDLRAFLAS